MKIINNVDHRTSKISKEIDLVSFTVSSFATQIVNEDSTNPTILTNLILENSNKISLDLSTNAVRNDSGKIIPFMSGTFSFQPNKNGGGTSRIHLISERSNDNGETWTGNLESLRFIEVSNTGEAFKTVESTMYNWVPGELLRFRSFNDAGGSINIESPSDFILGENYIGYSILWILQEKIKIN